MADNNISDQLVSYSAENLSRSNEVASYNPQASTPNESNDNIIEGDTSHNMDNTKSSTNDFGYPLSSKITKNKQEMTWDIYDLEIAKQELASAIIIHEYPLSIVDHIGFKRYSSALQPLFKVPDRNTIKKEIFKIYDAEKIMAMELLDNVEGRIAITSNMWTSANQKKGYMAITAQYIDSSWTLQNRILRFVYVPAPHTSDRLSTVLVKCLLDWNIDTKLSTITLDNCSINDSMIEKIKAKLNLSTLLKDGSLLHMCCCAYILNSIVKDGLDVVRDEVEKIRDSIVYWTATPKRMEKFKETARQLCLTYTKNLCLDCPTRWNSTYKMLDSAISYKEVFYRLKQHDDKYNCLPTSTQWEFASEICGKLKIFNSITELFADTNYPTTNLYFPKICEINLTISSWTTSPNVVIQQMAMRMLEKFKCYWNVSHDIMGVATVLDPRFKMSLLKYYSHKLYQVDAMVEVNRIQELCYELVSYYNQMNKESSIYHQDEGDNSTLDDSLNDFDAFVKRKKRARISHGKSELDLYLEEDVLPRTASFDILLWWKLNGIKYPTLQVIAKDILAIPISTVASKSAFNTCGRIVSSHRSKLHWRTLEALMCARSWLWSGEDKGTNSKVMNDAILLDEMDSDDEDELWASGIINGLEDD